MTIALIVVSFCFVATLTFWFFERRRFLGGQVQDSFRLMAMNALEGNAKQFLDLAKTSLEKESSLARMDLDQKQQSIHEMLNPVS